jgi:uncharacterized lipoprotein YehR (DUF1307 family)
MKSLNSFSLILFLSVNYFILSGCSDDDVSSYGELVVTFYNSTNGVSLDIYAIDNEDTPIYTSELHGPKEFKHNLNSGNYIIRLTGSSIHVITKIGFQIKSNTRTSIYYNESDSPSVLNH